MSYQNKTYVIFDGDQDMWAYAYMKGWKANPNMEFDFFDAHDLKPLTERASDETVYRRLSERLGNTKQAIVLIGEKTKNLFKFVRWELELVLKNEVPLIAINLNEKRSFDEERCPAILHGEYVVHTAFKAKIIKYALGNFPPFYEKRPANAKGPLYYPESVYKDLGIEDNE